MKNLSRLQAWTKVLFVLCMLPVVLLPGFLILHFFAPGVVPATFSFSVVRGAGGVIKLLIFASLVGAYCLLVYALYLFRKVLELFSKGRIFDEQVIENFSRIGRLIYYGVLLAAIPYNLYLVFTLRNYELDSDQLFNILLMGSLGLFFTVLAEVFRKGKEMKTETEQH